MFGNRRQSNYDGVSAWVMGRADGWQHFHYEYKVQKNLFRNRKRVVKLKK